MATDLGKVAMRLRGGWSSSATYEVLDAVIYNNGLYIAKQAVPANTLPTNTTYWQLALSDDYVIKLNGTTHTTTGKILPSSADQIQVGFSIILLGASTDYSDAPANFKGYSTVAFFKRSNSYVQALLMDRNFNIHLSLWQNGAWSEWKTLTFA